MRLARGNYMQMPSATPLVTDDCLAKGSQEEDVLLMSPGAEPGLKHELDAQEQIADTSVSGTEGNAHLKE